MLEHMILGIVCQQDATGYNIKKSLKRRYVCFINQVLEACILR